MTKEPQPIKCPCCGKELTDDQVKSLWAKLGSRKRRTRQISPELQTRMQEGRRRSRNADREGTR